MPKLAKPHRLLETYFESVYDSVEQTSGRRFVIASYKEFFIRSNVDSSSVLSDVRQDLIHALR